MNPAQLLAEGLSELQLVVPVETQKRLLAYLDLMAKWNRIYNLTAIRDVAAMVSAHLLDSLAVAAHLSARTVLDIGSGAGLPGLPLAMIWPQAEVTLLDSNQKKTTFLRQTVIELGINNVNVVCRRVETWQSPPLFELVISRAFADLPAFVAAAARFCADGGRLAALKGIFPGEEIARLPAGSAVRAVLPLRVPGLQAERHLVLVEP